MKNTIKVLLAALVVAATATMLTAQPPGCIFWLCLDNSRHPLPAVKVMDTGGNVLTPWITTSGPFTVMYWDVQDGYSVATAEPDATNYVAGNLYGSGPWPNTNIVSAPIVVFEHFQTGVLHCVCPTNGAQVSVTTLYGTKGTNAPPPDNTLTNSEYEP